MDRAGGNAEARKGGWASGAALLMVLLLVNMAAMWGQAGWGLEHVAPEIVPEHWTEVAALSLAVALGFATAVESIGVFLALSADEADESGLPSGGLRLASYAYGVFVSGGLNLSHWGLGAAGYAFFALSAISPFLWGVRARIRRGRKVAPSRRLWHPVRSVALIRAMAWHGVADEEAGMLLLGQGEASEGVPDPVPATATIEPAIEQVEPAPRQSTRSLPPGEPIPALLAARMLMDHPGAVPHAVAERSGLSVQNVRKYRQAVRTLADDPHADVAALKLRTDVIAEVRQWARGGAL